MKTTIKYLSLIAGFLAAATMGATAEDGKDGKGRPGGPGRGDRKPPKALLEKYDTDQSGDLDDDERAALRADMEKRRAEMKKRRAEMIAKYDEDQDGKLNEGERKKMILDRFDKDGSGDLDEEEKKAAARAMHRRGRGGPDGKRRGRPGPPRGERKPQG